jgi:pimeloyl-ACP methyl ester carboxylesterase
VIKSALAAEWRLESYFLGKAPSLKANGKPNGRANTPGRKEGDASTTSLNTDGMRSRSSVSDLRAADSLDGFSDDLSHALPGKYEPSVSPITASPAFAHALVQANHAESLSGTTADLLSVVLGRDAKPWGFSYTDIRHPCKIWYGAEDERVSEKSMRWMERAMDAELIVVQEEGHNLMSSRTVMYDVLDSIAEDI